VLGDPDALGWITVGAYIGAFVPCIACARLDRAIPPRRLLWIVLASVTGLLGVNKQLDLQSWLMSHGRDLVWALGLYGRRDVLRLVSVSVLALSFVAGLAALHRHMHPMSLDTPLRIALAGLALLAAFVVARLAVFHEVGRGQD